ESIGILKGAFYPSGRLIKAGKPAFVLIQIDVFSFRLAFRFGNFFIALIRRHRLFKIGTTQLYGGTLGIAQLEIIQCLIGVGEDAFVILALIRDGIVTADHLTSTTDSLTGAQLGLLIDGLKLSKGGFKAELTGLWLASELGESTQL